MAIIALASSVLAQDAANAGNNGGGLDLIVGLVSSLGNAGFAIWATVIGLPNLLYFALIGESGLVTVIVYGVTYLITNIMLGGNWFFSNQYPYTTYRIWTDSLNWQILYTFLY